jgi:hypothetical protein
VAVQEAFPGATIMRFGPLVGWEDRFYNDMALWVYSGYGVPVVDGGASSVQPLYCVDAAEAIYKSLEFSDAKSSVYELGGPLKMTYALAGIEASQRDTSQCAYLMVSLLSVHTTACKGGWHAGCARWRTRCAMRCGRIVDSSMCPLSWLAH